MAYTVMIVDDSETIRLVVRQSLSISKLPVDSVIYAVNGRDALEKLRAKWVDIVFSDINMPEMTGIELLETMQADPELKLIPIIIVSSEASSVRLAERSSSKKWLSTRWERGIDCSAEYDQGTDSRRLRGGPADPR
jgi:two-component system chemotaxis response regulator CheY